MKRYLFLVLFFFTILSLFFCQGIEAGVLKEIDYGIQIFKPELLNQKLDEQELFRLLESNERNLAVHAFLLTKYFSTLVSGTKPLDRVRSDVEGLMETLLTRFDPSKPASYFDRAFIFSLVAGLENRIHFPPKLYSMLALADMITLIQLEPLNPWNRLFFTIIYASLRDYDISAFRQKDPLDELKKALSFDVKDPHFHYVVATTFLALSQNSPEIQQLAHSEFELAKRLAPDNTLLHESISNIYVELLASYESESRDKPAWLEESVYRYLIEKDPSNPAPYNNLAFLYCVHGVKLDEALKLSKKAVELDKNNASFLDTLGCVYFKNQDTTNALLMLKKAFELSPDNKEINEHLSTFYLQLNMNEEAVPHLERLLRANPDDALNNNNLGYILAEINRDLETAENLIRKALEKEPQSPIYLDSLGWVQFKRGNIEEARKTLEKALSIDKTLGALYFHLGDVYFSSGNFEEALKNYSTGIRLEPGFPGAFDNLAILRFLSELKLHDREAFFKYLPQEVPFTYALYRKRFEYALEVLSGKTPEEAAKLFPSSISISQPPAQSETLATDEKSVEVIIKNEPETRENSLEPVKLPH